MTHTDALAKTHCSSSVRRIQRGRNRKFSSGILSLDVDQALVYNYLFIRDFNSLLIFKINHKV